MDNGKIVKAVGIFFKLAALAAVILAVIYFRNSEVVDFFDQARNATTDIGRQIQEAKENIANEFPQAQEPVSRTYQWQYQNKMYVVSHTLYSSVYEFYKSQPKTYTYFNELPKNWEEEYYGMFIAENPSDRSIVDLLEQIIIQGKKNGLSDDQLAELIVAFVQSIPYDDQKAANILARVGNETMDYPYEVLFENSGVCSDKSFLATVLLRKLGYGTALFVFENENHMAVGVRCPKEYSNYDSGYCFVETTSIGNKIGIIPELKSNVGSAVGSEQVAFFEENRIKNQSSVTKLTDVKIFQATEGNEYKGIIQTIKTNKEIELLKKELEVLSDELFKLKSDIGKAEAYLADKKSSLEKYLKEWDIKKYNERAEIYNDALSEYEDLIKIYNKKVKSYNEKAARYNALIKT